MWTLRTVRGGEKMTSVSDTTYPTKRAMIDATNRMTVTYRRRINNMLIVHATS